MPPVPDKPPSEYLLRPDPADPRLTERVRGIDHSGAAIETAVTVERSLTIFLNAQEIVTAMTIGDYPEYLALGYLLNQNMLRAADRAYLLRAGERIAEGSVGAVLTRERLEDLYGAPVEKLTDAATGHAAFLPG